MNTSARRRSAQGANEGGVIETNSAGRSLRRPGNEHDAVRLTFPRLLRRPERVFTPSPQEQVAQ